jgi:hypothetical protein
MVIAIIELTTITAGYILSKGGTCAAASVVSFAST